MALNGACTQSIDATVIWVGSLTTGDKILSYYWYRGYLRFDVSAIPVGATINTATLYLYYYDNDTGGVPSEVCKLGHTNDIGAALTCDPDWATGNEGNWLHDYGEFCDRAEGFGWKSMNVASSITAPFGWVSYCLKGSIEDLDSDYFRWYFYDTSYNGNDPYLDITWSVAGGVLRRLLVGVGL